MFLNSARRLEKESDVKVSAGDKKEGERAESRNNGSDSGAISGGVNETPTAQINTQIEMM